MALNRVSIVLISTILTACAAKTIIDESLGRIVGGEDARQGEIPYQISLLRDGKHYCGGSIIVVNGTQAILTAGHCLYTRNATRYTVVAGDVTRNDTTGIEQFRNVSEIVVHERFGAITLDNDIALIFPTEPFELNENVAPIPLPPRGQRVLGNVLVAGWGALKDDSDETPNVLQKVVLPVVDKDVCLEIYKPFPGVMMQEYHLCTGYLGEGGRDFCSGDSGGPLKSIEGEYQASIVSFGMGCARADVPSVSVQVSYFIDWIERVIAQR